jgi:hypothetical protein
VPSDSREASVSQSVEPLILSTCFARLYQLATNSPTQRTHHAAIFSIWIVRFFNFSQMYHLSYIDCERHLRSVARANTAYFGTTYPGAS